MNKNIPIFAALSKNFLWIEIGQSEYIDSFVRAYDFGGTVYEGKASYSNMEAALQDLEAGIKAYVEKWGI